MVEPFPCLSWSAGTDGALDVTLTTGFCEERVARISETCMFSIAEFIVKLLLLAALLSPVDLMGEYTHSPGGFITLFPCDISRGCSILTTCR